MIKITVTKGYTIFYDSSYKVFRLQDAEGDEVASGATQEEMEQKADKLSKQAFSFPIRAIYCSMNTPDIGRVTSINIDKEEVWFASDTNTGYGSRQKRRLSASGLFELSDANNMIISQVEDKRRRMAGLSTEIATLIKQLEKPINLAYFGLRAGS